MYSVRSNWWYLLPIFFGIIGGIIAYFAIRKDDREKAKKCIYLGLILLAVGIIVETAIAGGYLFPFSSIATILVGIIVETAIAGGAPTPGTWYGPNI